MVEGGITDLLARCGIGAFYRRVATDQKVEVVGGFKKRRQAKGPTVGARLPGMSIDHFYSLGRPKGVVSPDPVETMEFQDSRRTK